jgi:hypothetical protein
VLAARNPCVHHFADALLDAIRPDLIPRSAVEPHDGAARGGQVDWPKVPVPTGVPHGLFRQGWDSAGDACRRGNKMHTPYRRLQVMAL